MRLGRLDNKHMYVGYLNGKCHFVVMTDGLVHGSTTKSLRAHYKGAIFDPFNNAKYCFNASGNDITVSGQRYSLAGGHLVLVSVMHDSLTVKQLDVSFEHGMPDLAEDERVSAFFETSCNQKAVDSGVEAH